MANLLNRGGERVMKKEKDLLLHIQQLDFALVELTLYLDTHPDDMEAIRQFNELAYESRMAKRNYEEQYGPLLQYGGSYSGYPWTWNDSPWPWQI